MALYRALEAINFQTNSSLHKALTKIFQEVMDYRDGLKFEGITDIEISRTRKSLMLKYINEKLVPNLKSVIYKETGIIVKRVNLEGLNNVSGMFAVDLSLGNASAATEILLTQTGAKSEKKNPAQAVREMRELYQNLDLNSGTLNSSTFGAKRKIEIVLYLDVAGAFIPHDYIPVRFGAPLTAEELSAIYLHELGHLMVMIERSSNIFLTMDRISSHLTLSSIMDAPKTDWKDMLSCSADIVNEAFKKGQLSGTQKDTLTKAIESATYLLDRESTDLTDTLFEILYRGLGILLLTILFYGLRVVNIALVIQLAMSVVYEFELVDAQKGEKTSDVLHTQRATFNNERLADEFVSRHGAGSHLASALSKLESYMQGASFGTVKSVTLRRSGVFAAYIKLMCSILKSPFIVPHVSLIYEKHVDRLYRLAQNHRAIYKNILDQERLSHELQEYDRIVKEFEKARGNILKDKLASSLGFIGMWVNPVTIVASVKNGRLRHDYTKHLGQLDELMNNKLYVTSARFKTLNV